MFDKALLNAQKFYDPIPLAQQLKEFFSSLSFKFASIENVAEQVGMKERMKGAQKIIMQKKSYKSL